MLATLRSAAVAIVLGFAGMYWWLFVRTQGATTTAVKKPAVEAPRVAQPKPVEAPRAEAPPPAEESPAIHASSSRTVST